MSGMPVIHEVVAFMQERSHLVYNSPGFLRRPCGGAPGQSNVAVMR
jgi:hypothetical protein